MAYLDAQLSHISESHIVVLFEKTFDNFGIPLSLLERFPFNPELAEAGLGVGWYLRTRHYLEEPADASLSSVTVDCPI